MFLEEARKRLPEPFNQEQLEFFSKEEPYIYDPIYVSFEDQFRGTRQDIKERQKAYLLYIKEAGAGTEEYPVLDIGCGRGEWLELLRENGYAARGVDINRVLVEQCQDLGLSVVEDEALEYLKKQKNSSLGVITGFHVVEHLTTKHMISIFEETLRVLKTGGIAIFETPNPENILVGSCFFYNDPTHKNPIPPDTLAFLLEHRGFIAIKILRLSPLNYIQYEKEDTLKNILDRFNIEQDYAVIGRKA
jgi:O-antigen chain-terminating methyltransferase